MNLDKKLAKYAKRIDNPKYYLKILKIIDKADETRYRFKDFSDADIMHIFDVVDGYFEVYGEPEKHKEMIKFCNSYWFIITDKHYIVWISASFLLALSTIIRSYFLLFLSKLSRLINPAHFFECDNVNNNLYLKHGALKAAEFLGCEIFDLDEYRLEGL